MCNLFTEFDFDLYFSYDDHRPKGIILRVGVRLWLLFYCNNETHIASGSSILARNKSQLRCRCWCLFTRHKVFVSCIDVVVGRRWFDWDVNNLICCDSQPTKTSTAQNGRRHCCNVLRQCAEMRIVDYTTLSSLFVLCNYLGTMLYIVLVCYESSIFGKRDLQSFTSWRLLTYSN